MTPIDFLIITALEKEAKAVISRLDNHTTERYQAQDIRTYHCGNVPLRGTDRAYRVVVVLLPSMGEIAAATATTDAVVHWNPQFVLMVGIAGGFAQDDLDLGDVVVADQVVGYEYGKVTDDEIKPRDRVYPASSLLLDRVRNFWDDAWAQQIGVPRPSNAKRAAPKLFVGPIASGNKVIASEKFRAELTRRWPKLIAVEMEGEGVFAAVFDRPQIRGTLVIRGISDMADERKGDEWQEYAANAAAAYTIAFLHSGPVEPAESLPRAASPDAPDTRRVVYAEHVEHQQIVQGNYYEIHGDGNVLGDNLGSVTVTKTASLDPEVKRALAEIHRHLNQSEQRETQELLDAVHDWRESDVAAQREMRREMREMLDGLRRAFINLQARDLPAMDQRLRDAIAEVTEVVKANADLNTGLELSIPLIPLLLDYKMNLDLGGGLDLRQWWENLREKLLRGG